MARREDGKAKEPKKPKEVPLSPEKKKEALKKEIRRKFQQAFEHEDRGRQPR